MTKTAIAVTLVNALAYGGITTGFMLIFWKSFWLTYLGLKAGRRLSVHKKNALAMNRLHRHIFYLLGSSMERPCKPEAFVWGCGLFFLFLTMVSLRSFRLFTALGIGALGGFTPYLLLRIRLESRRRRGSMEGEKLVSQLLRQYRICGGNIYEALERVIPLIDDCKVSRGLLYRMLLRLRNTGNDLEIRESASMFAFGIGTNWSHMLSGCIRMGAVRGLNVSLGLEDILLQMRQAKKRMEERKRLNNEAMRLTLFMVPLLYLSTVLLSTHYLEVPPAKFIKNQMGTAEGLLLLLLIAFLFTLNLALIEMVNNQKLDY